MSAPLPFHLVGPVLDGAVPLSILVPVLLFAFLARSLRTMVCLPLASHAALGNCALVDNPVVLGASCVIRELVDSGAGDGTVFEQFLEVSTAVCALLNDAHCGYGALT